MVTKGSKEREIIGDFEPKWKLYRKKPIVIEAFKTKNELKIKTSEGMMKANKGDWIIKGVAGEIYPCKHKIFIKTYEEIKEKAIKWRWIEKGQLVRYVGRMNSKYRGMVGTALKLMGRKPMNILVDFDGEKVICPIGTLRQVRDK